jgi:tRNA 2-thiouridine synthesizing protein A
MSEKTTIDTRGAACTSALMELIAALRTVQIGDEVELLSADRGSAQEVADWCAEVRQDCLSVDDRNGYWSVLVRKAK